MGRALTTATRHGTRAEQLQIIAQRLAKAISQCKDDSKLAPLVKQYRETIRELDELKGAGHDDDDIGAILSQRAADGKPGAVRKDRS